MKCQLCQGHGELFSNGRVRQCHRCQGSGAGEAQADADAYNASLLALLLQGEPAAHDCENAHR